MISVFMLSVIPTIPSSFLTAADNPLYQGYNHGPRLWGISVMGDQQAAGAVMKIAGGFYLWGIIIVMFFRWMNSENDQTKKYRGKLVVTAPSGSAMPPGPAALPPTD